jgi:hypothetical protein
MSIAAAVIDFYDDSKHELMTKVSMPVEMQDANLTMLTPEQRQGLPDSDFGLIVLTKRASVLRKFPVNDPGNAWLSAQYFDQTHEKLAFPARFVAAKFIKKACNAYGVLASPLVDSYSSRTEDDEANTNTFVEGSESGWMLRKLAQRELSVEKNAAVEINALTELPNEHFALVIRQGDGSVIRKYAMPDQHHVKMAAAYFEKYATALPSEHRHRFAVSVQNRADELGMDVSAGDMLQKWSSTDWNKNVHAHIEQRKSLLPRNEKARGVLDKLAASIGTSNPEDMAEALKTFDDSTGLTKYHDRGLTDPYASTMDKVATGWSAEIDGRTILESDLRKVATTKKLAGYLGETFARQFSEHPTEIFESLPTTEKVLIKQVISGEA